MAKFDQCFQCLPSFIREWHSWKSWQKNKNQCSKISFFSPWLPRMSFPYGTWQSLKTLFKVCHQKNYIFFYFFYFTVHAKIIWAKTEMGTGQHFFHECKWHAHIGDVFLNILISYLNFFWVSMNFLWSFQSDGQTVKGQKHKRSKVVWAGTSVFGN